MKGYLTTKEAAERLGVTAARIRRMILDGVMKAEKVGRDNLIAEAEVKRLELTVRKAGRPPKSKNSINSKTKD